MSIDNKLRQIIQIKSDIKDAIVNKGVEMPAGLPFDQYASKVSEISGGGGDPVIKGYRQLRKHSGTVKVENNILMVDLDDSSSDGIVRQNNSTTDTSSTDCTAVVRMKMTKVTTNKPNIFFGSQDSSFCVGCGSNTTKLGVWLYTYGGNRLNGDDSTGQSSFELELDKWYYIRFHFYRDNRNNSVATLDIKERLEDEFVNIFTSSQIYNMLYQKPYEFFYGGTSYGGGFKGNCHIDLTESYFITDDGSNSWVDVPYC